MASAATTAMSEPGTIVAGYEVLRAIQRGGMGEVLLAMKRGAHGFERLVAIKTIRGELAEDTELRAMFVDEAKLMGRLHHPGIAHVHDLVEDGGALCLVMEYVAGISFEQLLERSPPPLICAQAIAEACRALDVAHELVDAGGKNLGVVHRDISPQNLMVTFDGGIKVVDFGIAWMRGRGTPETEYGLLKGKPPYMAPEQLKQAPIDRRTDVYACGVVLHEMLTGERLFAGRSPYEVVRQMMEPVAPPSDKAGALPDGLDAIVLRALESEPDERWQRARAMGRALDQVVAEHDSETLEAWVKRELCDLAEEHHAMLAAQISQVDSVHPQRFAGRASGVPTKIDTPQRPASVEPSATKPPAFETPPPVVPIDATPRRWGFLAALVAVLVVTGLWLTRPEVPEPARDVDESASTPENAPSLAAPSAEPDAADAVSATPSLVVSPTKVATSGTTLSKAVVEPPAPSATASAAPSASVAAEEWGYITFGAKPYANVTLDGAMIGPTPIVRRRVAAGSHSVVMVAPDSGDVRLRTSVSVTPGQVVDVVAR